MSFSIENILKKDFGHRMDGLENPVRFNPVKLQRSISMNDSILHQTLVRKNFSVCELSECHLPKYPYYNYYNNREKSYSNTYLDNIGNYQNIYEDRLWQAYNRGPLSVPCHQLSLFRRKGGQIRFTANQTDILEKTFLAHKYLAPEERKILADNLKLSDRQVKTWFQNRRAKWRRSLSSSSTDNSSDKPEDTKSADDVFLE
ncbi:transcription factor LBX1-like [Aethina tumida]|uniref:transcription factor LBX1-like n=1 Tax=Aethina tumida TaxID=116153 RepID=UPI0021483D2A|nr:transcription factor LBX1-like [Aethina tumida]